MKKYIYTFTLVLILTISLGAGAVELKDVPDNHWAYQSVQQLIEKGYLSLYEDGTFRGQDKVSRYEIAELVARILNSVYLGEEQTSEQDLNMLRKLSIEFRDELVDVANEQDIFKERLAEIQQKNLIQNEDIGKVNERLTEVEDNVTQIIDSILRVKQLEEKVAEMDAKIIKLEAEINENKKEFSNLNKELNSGHYQDLEDRQVINQNRINSLQARVNELENKLNNVTQAEVNKQDDNKKNNMYLIGLAGIALLSLM